MVLTIYPVRCYSDTVLTCYKLKNIPVHSASLVLSGGGMGSLLKGGGGGWAQS